MKLIAASAIAGLAFGMPQTAQDLPSGRFGTADIGAMITNMGASGDAAIALFKQFRELSGFERLLASNQAIAIAGFSGFGQGYGCWCYFGDDHLLKEAKGPPMDGIDTACHDLSRGYECATLDTDGCVPWQVDYETVPFGLGSDFKLLCEAANTALGQCAIDACAVESQFVSVVQALFNSGTTVDPLNLHSDAGFPALKTAECVGNGVGTSRDIVCCGQTPSRFPFNQLAPNKGCCADSTGAETQVFNSAFEQCCSGTDGSVIGLGETC